MHKEFVEKNWNSLNQNEIYYHFCITNRGDSNFTIEKLNYEETYSGKLAKFKPVGFSSSRLNIFLNEKEDEYESISAIIDKNQLAELEKEFKIYEIER